MGAPLVLADFTPVGGHQSVSLSASVATLSVPDGADGVLMQAVGQNVRYTLDGTAPSASVGFVLAVGGDPIRVPKNADITIRVIREAVGAVLQWQAVRNG